MNIETFAEREAVLSAIQNRGARVTPMMMFCHPEGALRESKDPGAGVPRLADSLGMTEGEEPGSLDSQTRSG